MVRGGDHRTCRTCGVNILVDEHCDCVRHAPCTDTLVFDPKQCFMCRGAATFVLHHPQDRTSDALVLLHLRWRNQQKLTSASDQSAFWGDLTLGLGRCISPSPSLAQLLQDRQRTRRVFAGFAPSIQQASTSHPQAGDDDTQSTSGPMTLAPTTSQEPTQTQTAVLPQAPSQSEILEQMSHDDLEEVPSGPPQAVDIPDEPFMSRAEKGGTGAPLGKAAASPTGASAVSSAALPPSLTVRSVVKSYLEKEGREESSPSQSHSSSPPPSPPMACSQAMSGTPHSTDTQMKQLLTWFAAMEQSFQELSEGQHLSSRERHTRKRKKHSLRRSTEGRAPSASHPPKTRRLVVLSSDKEEPVDVPQAGSSLPSQTEVFDDSEEAYQRARASIGTVVPEELIFPTLVSLVRMSPIHTQEGFPPGESLSHMVGSPTQPGPSHAEEEPSIAFHSGV